MAARYVNTDNIAAQGQSFYTGLLPGSYEKGGASGGSNVMGKGSGGSAGVTADRTASDAAKQSIEGYPKGGSIFDKPAEEKDPVTVNVFPSPDGRDGQAGRDGRDGRDAEPPGWVGGEQGRPPPTPVNATRGVTIDADSKEITTGSPPKALNPGSATPKAVTGSAAPKALGPGAQGLGSMIPGAPFGGVGQGTRPQQGLGTGQKPQHGPVQSIASSRSHTRQSGVQQSATQQSIPFPNMPNSTNRSLNF